MHRAFSCAQSFFQCRAQAQSFLPCTELFPVHRAFSCAQSFFLCTELFHEHRAFYCAQSLFLCAELFPVHRAFCRAQSFLPCTELSAVRRAFSSAQSFLPYTELWGPKPVIPTNVLAPKPPCLVQTPCAKTAKSCAFCDCTPEFYGGILYWLLEKQGKLYFLQSSQTKGIDVLASKKPSLVQTPCAKTAKSCAFCDSLPVSALECFSANETGGLWLWLGAFEKSRLYRCQSTPGPPMPVFCGAELFPVHRAFSCAQSFVLASKKPSLVQTPCAKTAKSCAFCDCTPEFYGGILFLLLEKQGKLYFLQSSQTKGRGETNFFDA